LLGRRAVVFTNNDTAYSAALTLAAAGVEVQARRRPRALTARRGGRGRGNHHPPRPRGDGYGRDLALAAVRSPDCADGLFEGEPQRIECDPLTVSGGWNPSLQLYSYLGGRLRYEPRIDAFVPASNCVEAWRGCR
jgi:sarcosine oxidase subunit alpha